MDPIPSVLLDLDALRVTATWRDMPFDDWADMRISASSFPFSGTVETTFTMDDLVQFRDALSALSLPGKVVLGGGRATYLGLEVEPQEGGEADRLVLEVTLIPSEDGGSPKLSFLIFHVEPTFAAQSAVAIDHFVRTRKPR